MKEKDIERLVERGLSAGFRIAQDDGRVLSIGWSKGRFSRGYLEGAEAEAVREVAARPLSLTVMPDCLLYDLYLPGFRGNNVVHIAANSDSAAQTATSLRSGIAWMETTLIGLQNEPEGWVRGQHGVSKAQLFGEWTALLEKMRACREHRLIFRPADHNVVSRG